MAEIASSDRDRELVLDRVGAVLKSVDLVKDPVSEQLGACFDAGLAWVQFPIGLGGLGVSPTLQGLADSALREGGLNVRLAWLNIAGVGMAAPTLLKFGTLKSQQRLLRPMFTNEEMWCQLFSEPSAGSDIASLACSAVRDGDEWIINGQKVWTTLAHLSKWAILVARSDPSAPKHRGLTFFYLDMDSPGVEVRPLRQMTGEAEFNEVFLDEVRVSDANRLGEVDNGWNVTLSVLSNERVAVSGGGSSQPGSGPISKAMALWSTRGGSGPVQRDRLMRLWVRSEVGRLTGLRARHKRLSGVPGPEGSVAKLAAAELSKDIFDLCVDMMGAEGMLYPDGYGFSRAEDVRFDLRDPRWMFLRTRANSIEGGTSEIMRTILGERVLGLPREPVVDRDVPWNQLSK